MFLTGGDRFCGVSIRINSWQEIHLNEAYRGVHAQPKSILRLQAALRVLSVTRPASQEGAHDGNTWRRLGLVGMPYTELVEGWETISSACSGRHVESSGGVEGNGLECSVRFDEKARLQSERRARDIKTGDASRRPGQAADCGLYARKASRLPLQNQAWSGGARLLGQCGCHLQSRRPGCGSLGSRGKPLELIWWGSTACC